MTEAAKESTIELINKLLAKANDPGVSQHEAEMFAAKAQELLARHNLEMADLQKDMPSDFVRVQSDFKYISPLWSGIASQTAALYFCKIIIVNAIEDNGGKQRLRKKFEFVGRKNNVDVAISMFHYLTKTIIRLMQKSSKDRKLQLQFERGCCLEMANRLRDMRLAAQTESSEGSNVSQSGVQGLPALYQNEKKEVDDFIERELGKLKKYGRGTTVENNDATQRGREAARNISLNNQVHGGSKGPALLK